MLLFAKLRPPVHGGPPPRRLPDGTREDGSRKDGTRKGRHYIS
jgi:hypothetical protein